MGLAAIVETADSLRRDDPRGNIIPPILTGYNDTTGTLEWTNIPPQLELTKSSRNCMKNTAQYPFWLMTLKDL